MTVRETVTHVQGLRRDAIGLREVTFQSITDMAPGAAIAASIPAGVAFATATRGACSPRATRRQDSAASPG